MRPVSYTHLDVYKRQVIIGILPGDGIGPIIMKQALRVIQKLLKPELENGHVEIRMIEGMTIENRAAKQQSLPDEVFEKIKNCNVLLKGPMVTPRAGDPWPNLVSANSLLRRGLELFAAVRPIRKMCIRDRDGSCQYSQHDKDCRRRS